MRFPLLKNIHYLDNAATTQKPKIVIDTLKGFYERHNANAHRGTYKLSEDATSMLEDSRKVFAKFLDASDEEIIFTKSATEGLNQLANSIEKTFKPGSSKNIVVTEIEHHSNFLPWQQLCKRTGAQFRVVKYKPDTDTLNDISELVDKDTLVVAFTGMSNVNGLLLDIDRMIADIRKKNSDAMIIIDATQLVAHKRLDVKSSGADFILFSAHKIYGTTGVGILYGRKSLLERLEPFFYGGNMIQSVSITDAVWAEIPEKFEAGTLDTAGIVASAEAIKFIDKDFEKLMKKEISLKNYALRKLRKIEYVRIIGHKNNNYGPVISIVVDGVHPHDLATICDRDNVCIRAGHHCAQPFMNALGLNATARISISFYNTKKDIDAFLKSLEDAKRIING